MISVSLPYAYLAHGGAPFDEAPDGQQELLTRLYAAGVRAVELRTVRGNSDPEEVAAVADRLWDAGFEISVHGVAKQADHDNGRTVSAVFDPLAVLLTRMRQKELIVVLHPVKAGNTERLLLLSDYISEHELPVRIALENNRLMPDKTDGDCMALVTQAVTEAARPNVGTCFDMGHYYYYVKTHFDEDEYPMPPREFLNHMIHTHIHALDDLHTHFPLDQFELPLADYCNEIGFRYYGRYNIELDFPRFAGRCDPRDALFGSVRTLRAAMPHCAAVYDDVRSNFVPQLESACSVLHRRLRSGTAFSLIRSTGYVFQTNGMSWAMDPTIGVARELTDASARITACFRHVKYIFITHSHGDHFERASVPLLAATGCKWIIPEFLVDDAQERGIKKKNIIVAHASEPLQAGVLNVLPFEGQHFRPDTHKGMPEYGYYITSENAPSLLFPADVRDFDREKFPEVGQVDYLFSHVWLGDKNALNPPCEPFTSRFADFSVAFAPKNIFLTHLYESSRRDNVMWRYVHAGLIADAIRERDPRICVRVPRPGENIRL